MGYLEQTQDSAVELLGCYHGENCAVERVERDEMEVLYDDDDDGDGWYDDEDCNDEQEMMARSGSVHGDHGEEEHHPGHARPPSMPVEPFGPFGLEGAGACAGNAEHRLVYPGVEL